MTRGTHQATTRHHGAVEVRPRPVLVWGPPGPPLTHLSLTPFSLPTIHTTIAQTRVLAALAQPIFAAEIWINCSPVCDSSDYPNRILFSGVSLDYFAAVGDRLSELACLFYALISCFDACLVLLQVPIVFPFIYLSQNSFL